MRTLFFAIVITLVTGALGGCVIPPLSPDTYPRSQTNRAFGVQYGEVLMVREVPIAGEAGTIGRLGGAYAGGAIGAAAGDGTGSVIVSSVGVIAGAAIGEKVQEVATRQIGLEITVKVETGKTITIVQGNDVVFEEGERVRVLSRANDSARILKD